MEQQTYESPDVELRLVLTHSDDGDVTLGFEGFPWHTHGDLLVPLYGEAKDAAAECFVRNIIESRAIIAIYRRGNVVFDVQITLDPEADIKYCDAGEIIEHRLWDGSRAA